MHVSALNLVCTKVKVICESFFIFETVAFVINELTFSYGTVPSRKDNLSRYIIMQ